MSRLYGDVGGLAYLQAMAQTAFYSLRDWHPSAGPEDEWLAGWAEAGWVPEWPPPYEGVWCEVGGVERKRYSMVRAGSWADRYASRRALGAGTVPR